MNLTQNLQDTVKEWEIKIGFLPGTDIRLYYPQDTLEELLDTDSEHLAQAIGRYRQNTSDLFAGCTIEAADDGRWCVIVPADCTAYVHEHVEMNPFLPAFLKIITTPMSHLPDVVRVFRQFSDRICIDRQKELEWGICFADEEIDPYIYYVEEDDFGLEYHRFTRRSYRKLFGKLPEMC